MKPHRESRVITVLILDLGARWMSVVNATPWPLYPRQGTPVPTVQEARWAPPTIEPQTAKPITSRYTHYTIPVQSPDLYVKEYIYARSKCVSERIRNNNS